MSLEDDQERTVLVELMVLKVVEGRSWEKQGRSQKLDVWNVQPLVRKPCLWTSEFEQALPLLPVHF